MAQDLDLESIHGAWVQQLISEAATWNTVLLTPNSMFDVLEKCSPSTSLVFTLQPGEYVFRKPLTIHRAAPCIIRAQGSSTVRFVNAPKDELNKNDSSVKQGLQAGGMVRVHGSGNVVFEGITFEARNGHRDFEACIAIRSDGFVCLSDCHFASACSSSNGNEPVTVDEINREVTGGGGECSCVEISQTRGVFFTQCEFLAGDAGIACQVTSSASSSRGLEPPVIAVEDCGFSSSRKFQPDDATLENVVSHRLVGELRCGIRLRKPRLSDSQAITDGSSSQGKAKGKKNNTEENSKAKATSSSTLSAIPYILRVDHSSFESIEGPFIETCAAAVVSAAVTVEHCTMTHCGDELLPAALMRGRCSLHMHDCSMSSCGVVVLAHHSTTTMKECTISSPIPSSSESSSAPVRVLDTTLVPYHRQIVVQDKANVVVQRCEWIGNANASPREEIAPSGNEVSTNEAVCGAQFAFMSLLSSGRVAIEGSVFRFGLNNNGDDLDLVENSVASLSAASTTVAILVDGSCAPHISGNKFHSDLHLSHGSKQRGVLLGLWHDAQMQDNEFSGTFATEESYCGLEEFPQSMILAQPHGSAAMGNELEEDSVASSSEHQHHQQQQQQQPKIPSTNTSMDDENAAALPVATTAAVPVQKKHEEDRKEVERTIPADDPETDDDDDDHDNLVQHNDQKDVDRDNASSTIAKLRAQVKALKGQLKKQQHTTTMTDTKVKPPSRPSSAKPVRPASAKSSRSSRPTSASVTRPSTAATTRENIDNNSKDDHLVRIGHHKWNMTLMKPFMQGLVPLSQVRRVATPDIPNGDGTNQNRTKRTISPSAIYDNWKRAQTDKRDAEKMLLNRAKAEEMAKQRRLTPRQQQESVARLHTESVEHNKEVRERCIAEETSRFQPHQPITNKTNDAVLELAGDFQDRLCKDLRDRELRRENLLKKYIPEQSRTRRSQSEIVAYASSLHKAHHDASLVARAEAEAGITIRVAPPRSAYPKQRPHRKVLKADELIDYCTSLYHSHKEERLAERAAAIAGEEAVARVASRSSSRR